MKRKIDKDLHKFFKVSESFFGIKVSEAEKKRMCNRWIKADKILRKAFAKIMKERSEEKMKKEKLEVMAINEIVKIISSILEELSPEVSKKFWRKVEKNKKLRFLTKGF